MKLFNTYGRRKEKFVPSGKNIGFYTCGPTAYAPPHIGNYRTYVWEDVIRRYLECSGYRVKHIMNITDLDDILLNEAKKKKTSWRALSQKYGKIFLKEKKMLECLEAYKYPRASEHIKEMVKVAQKLLRKKYAYRDEKGDIYFDISRFSEYGRLSNFKPAKKERKISKQDYWQYEAGDFLLWRNCNKKTNPDACWSTPIGIGMPAWNLECPAMSMKYLGEEFEIHMGGTDNVFSHHENEIAVAKCASGKKFVRYWMHVKHLLLDGKKMSKSKGNVIVLEDLLRKGYSAREVRAALLSVHYRRRMNFAFARMERIAKYVRGVEAAIKLVKKAAQNSKYSESDAQILSAIKMGKHALECFKYNMDNDFNAPHILHHCCNLICWAQERAKKGRLGKKSAQIVLRSVHKINSVLNVLEV